MLIKQKEAEQLSNHWSDPSGKSPGFLRMALAFEAVTNLDLFQLKWMLFLKEKRDRQIQHEITNWVSSFDERGIVPGKPYDTPDYISRFQFILDIMQLLGEIGELKKAREFYRIVHILS